MSTHKLIKNYFWEKMGETVVSPFSYSLGKENLYWEWKWFLKLNDTASWHCYHNNGLDQLQQMESCMVHTGCESGPKGLILFTAIAVTSQGI